MAIPTSVANDPKARKSATLDQSQRSAASKFAAPKSVICVLRGVATR